MSNNDCQRKETATGKKKKRKPIPGTLAGSGDSPEMIMGEVPKTIQAVFDKKTITALLVWEMGHGLGHINNLLAVESVLVAMGYRTVFAVQNVALTRQRYAGAGTQFIQAPTLNKPLARILHVDGETGFINTRGNETAVNAWHKIFAQVQPHLVVFESAPLALLVSQSYHCKRVRVGTGWSEPPRAYSQPKRLRFDATLITTLPPLDRFPQPRDDRHHVGPLSASDLFNSRLSDPLSPSHSPLVVAYVNAGHWATTIVIDALEALKIEARIYCAGHAYQHADSVREWVKLSPTPLAYGDYLPRARLMICHGNANSVATALCYGVPCLIFPGQCEQAFVGQKTTESGVGIALQAAMNHQLLCDVIERAIFSTRLKSNAESFAQQHRHYLVDAHRLVRLCTSV